MNPNIPLLPILLKQASDLRFMASVFGLCVVAAMIVVAVYMFWKKGDKL